MGATMVMTGCSNNKAETVSDELPYFVSSDLTPVWINKNSDEYKNIHKIANFSLLDQNGNVVTNNTFEGKMYITDFFFTSCPGLCTNLSQVMKLLQDYFEKDSSVLLLSHTVTPKIDSVSVLKKYAKSKYAIEWKWYFVTGDRDDIYELARTSYFADGNYNIEFDVNSFFHSENFTLVDQHGRIRGVYNGTLPADMERLKEDVKILEKENI